MDARPLNWRGAASKSWLPATWPVLLGILVLAVPTFWQLAEQHWSTEAGAHGPLVIATGSWLIWRRTRDFQGQYEPGRFSISLSILSVALLLYCFGRAFDYLVMQSAGLYGAVIAAVYQYWGALLLRHLSFPLVYLALAMPVPGWALDYLTAPLKHLASIATTGLLQAVGIPIVREGVTLFVAQYQLLVEDACAGLNALMGLTALGLFYAYLAHGASWKYALLLTSFIIPIAVAANIIRIIILVLLTLWGGNDAAQGFLHGAAGLVMFASALGMIFIIDASLSRLGRFGTTAVQP